MFAGHGEPLSFIGDENELEVWVRRPRRRESDIAEPGRDALGQLDPRALVQHELDAGPAAEMTAHEPRHEPGAQRMEKVEADGAAVRVAYPSHGLNPCDHLGIRAAQMLAQHLPAAVEAQPAGGPVEKLRAHIVLEALEPPRQRRLWDAQKIRRRAHRADRAECEKPLGTPASYQHVALTALCSCI